jgi:transposase
MRYQPSDGEWATITPMLPNKARGVPRGDDWRVLNCHLRFLQLLRAEARKVAGVYS